MSLIITRPIFNTSKIVTGSKINFRKRIDNKKWDNWQEALVINISLDSLTAINLGAKSKPDSIKIHIDDIIEELYDIQVI